LRTLRAWLSRLGDLFNRQRRDREFAEELESHLRFHTEDNLRAGMTPDEARRQALIRLGGVDQAKENYREGQGVLWLETFAQDVRFGMRMLWRNSGLTSIAVLILALGIGANVAIFSFVNTLLLRPISAKNSTGMVRIKDNLSYPEYEYLREHSQTLREVTAHYSSAPFYVSLNGESSEVQGAVVSSGYFQLLGLRPLMGRFFRPEEDSVPDSAAVAVVSDAFWRASFDSDPNIVGKSLAINGRTFTVIGVMPSDFRGVVVGGTPNEIWIPATMVRVGYRWCDGFRSDCAPFEVMGRLAPGASVSRAQAEVATLLGQFRSTIPDLDNHPVFTVTTESELYVGRKYLIILLQLLSATAALLLFVVCANVGGLMTARGMTRSSEISMRLALGAGRERIVRQLFTESMMLACVGGALGVLVSRWFVSLLINFDNNVDAEGYRHFLEVSLDRNVLIYSIGITLLAGILFGLLPAWSASRLDINESLKGGTNQRRSRTRLVLVALQIALSPFLMVAAGLLARSAVQIETGNNMDVHNVIGLRLRPQMLKYTPAKAQAFQREVVRRLREVPGVQSVSLAKGIGLIWTGYSDARLALPGKVYPRPESEPVIGEKEVGSSYFATLKIPFIGGRDCDADDNQSSPLVAIVNETLANQISPGEAPLERAIVLNGASYQIVGEVKDAQLRSALESPLPVAYLSYWQNETEVDARMCIRVAGDQAAMLSVIRKTIASIDSNVPITETMPLIDQVRGEYVDARLAGAVLGVAAGLALLLCAVGLYGVIAYDVRQRTRELGIRIALGASSSSVITLFLKRALGIVLIGGAAGLLAALATTQLIAAFLLGVSRFDRATFCIATAVVFAATLLASFFPTRRAIRVDPMVALRHE
jgi:predicted permease